MKENAFVIETNIETGNDTLCISLRGGGVPTEKSFSFSLFTLLYLNNPQYVLQI